MNGIKKFTTWTTDNFWVFVALNALVLLYALSNGALFGAMCYGAGRSEAADECFRVMIQPAIIMAAIFVAVVTFKVIKKPSIASVINSIPSLILGARLIIWLISSWVAILRGG